MGTITRNAANNFTTGGVILPAAINDTSVASISELENTSTGALTLISEHTASGSANIQITSGIDSTYPIYIFDFINLHPSSSGNENFLMNFSTDGGSNYNVTKTSTAIVSYNYETVPATGCIYDTSRDLAQSTSDQVIASEISSDSDSGMSGRMFLFNPSSTTFVKHFMSQMVGTNDPGTNEEWGHTDIMSGYGNTTSAINGVRFKFVSHNIDSGKIKLYGISGS